MPSRTFIFTIPTNLFLHNISIVFPLRSNKALGCNFLIESVSDVAPDFLILQGSGPQTETILALYIVASELVDPLLHCKILALVV